MDELQQLILDATDWRVDGYTKQAAIKRLREIKEEICQLFESKPISNANTTGATHSKPELREKIIHWLAHYDHLVKQGNAPQVTETVDQILALIKEAGYVKLADDQTLPKADNARGYPTHIDWRDGQEAMLKAGWRKVEVKDEH